jgi:hypothetical protein
MAEKPEVTRSRQILFRYIENLFKYLNNQAYCFTSGAFVIEDNPIAGHERGELSELLFSITPLAYPAVRSHKTYLTNREDPVYETKLSSDCLSRISVNCNIGGITAANSFVMVKWFPFATGGKNYIFLKPETSCGSNNPGHAKDALIKKGTSLLKKATISTGFSSPPIKRPYQQIISRREDCRNFADDPCLYTQSDVVRQLQQDPHLPFMMFKTTKIIDGTNESTHFNKETYVRRGDEVFIIEPVSRFILKTIRESKIFKVDDADLIDHEYVTITNTPAAAAASAARGGMKSTKKSKNKKSKTKRSKKRNLKYKKSKTYKNK